MSKLMTREEIIEAVGAFNATLKDKNTKLELVDGSCQIAAVWHVEDVKQQAVNGGEEITDDEAFEALQDVKHYHDDCNYGITWDHIDTAIEGVIKNRTQEVK